MSLSPVRQQQQQLGAGQEQDSVLGLSGFSRGSFLEGSFEGLNSLAEFAARSDNELPTPVAAATASAANVGEDISSFVRGLKEGKTPIRTPLSTSLGATPGSFEMAWNELSSPDDLLLKTRSGGRSKQQQREEGKTNFFDGNDSLSRLFKEQISAEKATAATTATPVLVASESRNSFVMASETLADAATAALFSDASRESPLKIGTKQKKGKNRITVATLPMHDFTLNTNRTKVSPTQQVRRQVDFNKPSPASVDNDMAKSKAAANDSKKRGRSYGAWSLEDRANCLLAMIQTRREYRQHLEKGGCGESAQTRRTGDLVAMSRLLNKNKSQIRDYYYRCIRKVESLLQADYAGQFDLSLPDLANEAVFHFHRHVEMLGLHLGLHFKSELLNTAVTSRYWELKADASSVSHAEVQAALADAETLDIQDEKKAAELLHASLLELLSRSENPTKPLPPAAKAKASTKPAKSKGPNIQSTILGALSLGYNSSPPSETSLFDIAFRKVALSWKQKCSGKPKALPVPTVPQGPPLENTKVVAVAAMAAIAKNDTLEPAAKRQKRATITKGGIVTLGMLPPESRLPQVHEPQKVKLHHTAPLATGGITVYFEPIDSKIEKALLQASIVPVFHIALLSSRNLGKLFEYLENYELRQACALFKGKLLYLSVKQFHEELKWTYAKHGSTTIAEICALLGFASSSSTLKLGFGWEGVA